MAHAWKRGTGETQRNLLCNPKTVHTLFTGCDTAPAAQGDVAPAQPMAIPPPPSLPYRTTWCEKERGWCSKAILILQSRFAFHLLKQQVAREREHRTLCPARLHSLCTIGKALYTWASLQAAATDPCLASSF